MSQLRKLSVKPVSTVKEPSTESAVEFRWSISAARFALLEENSSTNLHLVDISSSKLKSSPRLPGRNSTNRSTLSTQKRLSCSPRLPKINNVKRKKELPTPTNQNNNGLISPLILSYSQLHRAQQSPQKSKTSRAHFSIYPLVNDKRDHISDVNSNASPSPESPSSPTSQQRLSPNTYRRLHTPQLRRLHISEKYMKEAKTLYFNDTSKVFVPRYSLIQISSDE